MGSGSHKDVENRGLEMSSGNRDIMTFEGGMGKAPCSGWKPHCKMESPSRPPRFDQGGR